MAEKPENTVEQQWKPRFRFSAKKTRFRLCSRSSTKGNAIYEIYSQNLRLHLPHRSYTGIIYPAAQNFDLPLDLTTGVSWRGIHSSSEHQKSRQFFQGIVHNSQIF
jgi:hypothetical protein